MPIPGFGAMLGSYRAQLKVSIKRSGRLKPPVFTDYELARIGKIVVQNQKALRAEQYEEMIGFSPPEIAIVGAEFAALTVKYSKAAWQAMGLMP